MRECEIKIPLASTAFSLEMLYSLARLGAYLHDAREEIDLVLDTGDFAMRNAGLLLRYRRVKFNTDSRILVTLKVSPDATSQDRWFQEHAEIEFIGGDTEHARQTSEIIRREVSSRTGLTLPVLNPPGTLAEWWGRLAKSCGDLAVRSLVEKRRVILKGELSGSSWEACLDLFPPPVGPYLEFETTSPHSLELLLERIGVPENVLDARTYGQIVGERTEAATGKSSRVLVFETTADEIGWLTSQYGASTTPNVDV
ncbi:MAG: hypothetical protein H0T72_14320 [Chloroflexia bacterium]|nr:hypothetical protein [Chloroflexia bacterium]